MIRSAVYGLLVVTLAQLVRTDLVELSDQSDVVSTQRGVGTGKSTVWQFLDAKNDKSISGNHFQTGWKSPGSYMIRREVIQSPDNVTYFNFHTAGIMTYIEARDQSNGTGGFVSYFYGGLQLKFLMMEFSLVEWATSSIDFIVEVWGLPRVPDYWPAANFRVGQLTERSAFHISVGFNQTAMDGEYLSYHFEEIGLPETKFTFIEAFDLSNDGSGGLVRLLDGGIGRNFFNVYVRSVWPGMPVNVTIVAYSVDELNGGQNFRIGTYKPGMQTLAVGTLEQDAQRDEIQTDSFNYTNTDGSTIEFVQGWDRVPRGNGSLVAFAGGLGFSNVSLVVASGVGEDLDMLISVFGRIK